MKPELNSGTCSINELKAKEIINIHDGARLGSLADIELDLETGRLVSIIVPGPYKLMGFLGKEDDLVIKWEDIKTAAKAAAFYDLTVFKIIAPNISRQPKSSTGLIVSCRIIIPDIRAKTDSRLIRIDALAASVYF